MSDTIRIKCPSCGAVLTVKDMPGLETKSVNCPVCKQRAPFTQYKKVDESDDHTQYPDGVRGGSAHSGDSEKTKVDFNVNYTVGRLCVMPSGPTFQLKKGKNVIGRKASQSVADVQISTGESRKLSREHLTIDVNLVPGKGMRHYVSLYKQKVNKTFIGSVPLEYGDCIVLKHGDIIKLPDVSLRFIVPDGDETEM